jgi:signal transduction histidine kinase
MLRTLRLRLTLLYAAVGLGLMALVGAGAYQLLAYYFQTTTDLALQHKLAHEFVLLGVDLPPELAAADAAWYSGRLDFPAPTPSPYNGEGDGEPHPVPSDELDNFDSELAAIFIVPLDADGQPLDMPGGTINLRGFTPDQGAVQAALVNGRDWRIAHMTDGERVRLVTYRVNLGQSLLLLQAGRSLIDQDRILGQLLAGLIVLGIVSTALLGLGSWWVAGRSLAPAQSAWERQQSFVANASHELRTPLTLIRASSEVARRSLPSGDTDNRALLDDVLHEVDHMSRLVDDLLLLSRLDAGRLALEHVPIDMPELLSDVQRQVGRVASERGVTLLIEESAGTVWGDATRLRQVLLILLDNALRHTPTGGAVRLRADPQARLVRVTVADNGEGIASEHLPHIFERFYRAGNGRTSADEGGSGLGLAIAKALVEAMQGQVLLESTPGQGTRVTLTLPAGG